jgi:kynurenine formamidase
MKMQQIIDLSVAIKAGIASDPKSQLPEIHYSDHTIGAEQMVSIFPGLNLNDLPQKQGWAMEFLKINTHSGTHIDAPYHYHAVDDSGNPMPTIDEIPLDWFFGFGVKLDFRKFKNGHVVTVDEIKAELERIDHELRPGDIVLVNTAAGDKYGDDNYLDSGCGIGREGTLYLTEHGVRLVGTDAWSWDTPFNSMRKRFEETKDPSTIWEGHFAGCIRPYCQIEKLGNLDKLPPTGFQVIALPVNVYKASAGWARPVAIIDENGGE